uniref:Claudin n=1 Tax=Arion vulgaris TaxID=1028688 RepID=A0A0B6ZIV5_9EUPU
MGCIDLDKRFLLLVSSLACTFLASALVIIGLCTNNWVELRDRNLYRNDVIVHFGLHRVCWVNNNNCNNPGNDYDQQNALPAVQGILIAGGFLSVFATLITLFNLLCDRLGRSSGLISVGNAALACIAGVMILVGVIVFGVRVQVRTDYIITGYYEFFGFSFGLTVCAGILNIIAAIMSGVTGLSAAEKKFNI